MDKKLSLLCFHLFLVLSYLLYQVSMFLKLHNTTNCFKFSESFAAFWTSKKFQQWSFQKNSRKIIIKISTSGETQRGLGPTRGGHQWPRRPAGAAQHLAAPIGRLGPTGPASRWVFFLSLSFSPKTRVLHLFLRSCCSWRQFSISLYSLSFELRFWTNTHWYVTPPPLQLDFWLVASFVSI